jgi:BRCA1-associated protein
VPVTSRSRERLPERQYLERTTSYPPPTADAALKPETAVRDWRFGRVSILTVDLTMAAGPAPELGPTGSGAATKAECLSVVTKKAGVGWGIVHFYRDGEETPYLSAVDAEKEKVDGTEECTIMCIPAVPFYMSPADLVVFLGEEWTKDISHCRMVMTERMNRYMVLLKFREAARARAWRKAFDGKIFNRMDVSASSFCGWQRELLLTTIDSRKYVMPYASRKLHSRHRGRRQPM